MAEVILNMDNFDAEVIECDKPVLVDFWASWCGPCQALGPIVSEVSNEYGDKVKVCKLNIDENMGLAQKYRVMSIPTLKLFKNGEVVATSVGLINKEEMVEFISQ